jgi:hypothetical protein
MSPGKTTQYFDETEGNLHFSPKTFPVPQSVRPRQSALDRRGRTFLPKGGARLARAYFYDLFIYFFCRMVKQSEKI